MKKRLLIVLLLICFVSIMTNIFQFNRIRKYNIEEHLYTTAVENSFKEFIAGLDYYDDKVPPLSNESAIKNSVSAVTGMRNTAPLSSYKNNVQLSLMLLNLNMFFVMESNEYINDNINTIKPQLTNISKNLNDEKAIADLNTVLDKLLSNV